MAVVKQSGDFANLRMGRLRLWSPRALLSIAPLAVDPAVNPTCFNNGNGTFNWLMQIDKKALTIKTGGARGSNDAGKTFSFLTETVDASKLGEVCSGFVGPKDPVNLAPITIKATFADGAYTTEKIERINVPIFSSMTPVILPLRDAYLKDVKLSADGTCVGKFDKGFWCDGETLGWTTGGSLVAKITVADADLVPVSSASCQSLCKILVNDLSKSDKLLCKKNPDGTYPEIGDTCVGGTGCKNAFSLSASFGASGVNIETVSTTPSDAGADVSASDAHPD
ncbi:MAG: hypothetical protein NVSMB1_12820 [Polyangiales bacterium]